MLNIFRQRRYVVVIYDLADKRLGELAFTYFHSTAEHVRKQYPPPDISAGRPLYRIKVERCEMKS